MKLLGLARLGVERLARARLAAQPRLWDVLQHYLAQSDSTGCSYADYEVLYRWVRRHRPHEVLECGTGVSTVVLAQALLENAEEGGAPGRLVSMEESEPWFERARALLPRSLHDFVELCWSPTVEESHSLFRGMRYRDVPDRPYEFVFVDGPSTCSHADGDRTCDLDLVTVLRRTRRPVSAVVDGRLATCWVLQQVLGPAFRFDPLRRLGVVTEASRADLHGLGPLSSRAMRSTLHLLGRSRLEICLEDPAIRTGPTRGEALAAPAGARSASG